MTESSLYKTALSKAMAQCSKREYCTEDIRSKLGIWGVGSADAERIITALIKENFINESRYATAFVRDKFRYNKWGKIKISSYLKIKKIPADIIKSALDNIDYEAYKKQLRDIINKQRKSIKAKDQYELKAKLLRFGLSRGFENWIILDILNETDPIT